MLFPCFHHWLKVRKPWKSRLFRSIEVFWLCYRLCLQR
jgi:lipopolysaccharide biosynthesis glycosyltransferase